MNAYYKLYVDSVFRLASTLVIKDAKTAATINARMLLEGYPVNPDNPRTWKYYLNLAGLRHASDPAIKVVSLDTREEIDFTNANLQIHKATARGYVYGTDYYEELVEKYPKHTGLINGIINPLPLDTTIMAADHNILFYDQALVEPNEQQLIPALQAFVTEFFTTRANQNYTLVDSIYHLGILVTLYTKLPAEIRNIRKRACLTDQAHTYHVRQYLLSFSPVGEEFDYMTQKQRLFLYRNIRYLNLNIGTQATFQLMTQKFLTDRGFSLARYDFTHNYEDTVETLVPEIIMKRVTINGIEPADGSDTKKVIELLELEQKLNRDNPLVMDVSEVTATLAMERSKTSVLKSKVLESNVIDRTDNEPFTLTEVLLNHWMYLSHYDIYKPMVGFTNPANGEFYSLSAKNAFIFYLYAYNKSIDVTLSKVPVISANRVRRIPLPTKTELRKYASKKHVPDYYLDYILDTQVKIENYISIDAFRAACQRIHKVMLSHREMRHYNGDFQAEGELHTVIDRCYMDIRIDLAKSVTYESWLADMRIDTTSMGRLDYQEIAKEIFRTASGADLSTAITMREIHASMVRIMRKMSSYSVQIIPQINDSPIKVVDGKFPKLTIPIQHHEGYVFVESSWTTILGKTVTQKIGMDIRPHLPVIDSHTAVQAISMHIPVKVDVKSMFIHDRAAPIASPLPYVVMVPDPMKDLGTVVVNGIFGYRELQYTNLSDLVTGTTLPGYEELTDARRTRFLSI